MRKIITLILILFTLTLSSYSSTKPYEALYIDGDKITVLKKTDINSKLDSTKVFTYEQMPEIVIFEKGKIKEFRKEDINEKTNLSAILHKDSLSNKEFVKYAKDHSKNKFYKRTPNDMNNINKYIY